MTGFKVLSTNHTSFTVSNLDRTIAFFRDALGFEVTSKAPRDPDAIERITGVEGSEVMIAYVRGPGHSIELIEYLAPADRGKVESRPCDTGFAHVATTSMTSTPPSPRRRNTGSRRAARSTASTRDPTQGRGSSTSSTAMASPWSSSSRRGERPR